MQFQIPIHIPQLQPSISYEDNILLMGSCFTEHIGKFLEEDKFNIVQNPFGIVFDPETLSKSIVDLMEENYIDESELFQQDGIWHHWKFHSRYSGLDKAKVLEGMNESIKKGHDFLKKADWLILTLGTSYVYRLKETNQDLLSKNAELQNRVLVLESYIHKMSTDSIKTNAVLQDSLPHKHYDYIIGRVINNSISQVKNYITINGGSKNGLHSDMGVISQQGIVGIVRTVSDNY
ncbi:MAG: hypothetical protein DI598_19575, partial [Pseudopedobacter saltans]